MNYQPAYSQAQDALSSGDQGRALALLEQAAALAQKEGEFEAAIDILQEAHALAEESGQLEHASSLIEQAVGLAGAVGNPTLQGALLNNLAMTQKRGGYSFRAKATLERALDMLLGASALNEAGTTWNNLGFVERDLGNLQPALTCHQKALAIFEQTGDQTGTVRTLLETGIVHKDLGQLSEARTDLERALALSINQEDALRDRGHALTGLGLTSQLLNDDQSARRYFEEALATYRQARDRENEALVLHNLGLLHDNEEAFEAALPYYLRSLEINREIGAAMGIADDLSSIAALNQAKGDDEQARRTHEQALQQYEAMGFREGQIDTLVDLGILARNTHRLAEAERRMTQALVLAREGGSPRLLYEVYLNRGDVYLLAGKLRKSAQDYTAAIAAIESIRLNLVLEEEALGFFAAPRLEAYERLVRLHARGLRQPRRSLQWAERAKSREFLRRLSASSLVPARHIPAELLHREAQWLERLRAAASLLGSPGVPDRRTVLRDYGTAAEKLQAVWDEIERYDREYVDLRRGEPLSWKELKCLLSAGAEH